MREHISITLNVILCMIDLARIKNMVLQGESAGGNILTCKKHIFILYFPSIMNYIAR